MQTIGDLPLPSVKETTRQMFTEDLSNKSKRCSQIQNGEEKKKDREATGRQEGYLGEDALLAQHRLTGWLEQCQWSVWSQNWKGTRCQGLVSVIHFRVTNKEKDRRKPLKITSPMAKYFEEAVWEFNSDVRKKFWNVEVLPSSSVGG